jgi:hypothetical protein
MDDDTGSPRSEYDRPWAGMAGLSKTPSWVMLGFAFGALFVFALMRERRPAGPPPVAAPPAFEAPAPPVPRRVPALTTIEAVFEAWGEHAVWSGPTTEVALWSPQDRAFSEFYEVRRIDGRLYFRSLPELTRRIIRRGKELSDCPLQFTETEAQYREWLEFGRRERPAEPGSVTPVRPAPSLPPEVRK